MSLLKKIFLLALFLNLAALKVFADEWENTTAEDMGISQEEFQKVKESGMSKSKFLKLLEVGISPNEYFSEPWKKLGVTEEHWLTEKKAGMADDDIDRSYRKQDANNLTPFVSFVLPGYYEYKTKKTYLGLGLSTAAVAGIALTFLPEHGNPQYLSHLPHHHPAVHGHQRRGRVPGHPLRGQPGCIPFQLEPGTGARGRGSRIGRGFLVVYGQMLREILKSKIHRATVTDANLNYTGSITIDPVLMSLADIREYEKVNIVNINNGARFETYAISGKPESGEVCVNGAAARLVHVGISSSS